MIFDNSFLMLDYILSRLQLLPPAERPSILRLILRFWELPITIPMVYILLIGEPLTKLLWILESWGPPLVNKLPDLIFGLAQLYIIGILLVIGDFVPFCLYVARAGISFWRSKPIPQYYANIPTWYYRRVVAYWGGLPPPTDRLINVEDVSMEIEGVKFSATLFRPIRLDGEKLPTILVRSPYNRRHSWHLLQFFWERGYNVLVQDCRGRYGSEGDFSPLDTEKEDGGATIEWITKQPWFNGQVGMHGVSYMGLCIWAAMGCKNPALVATAPCMASTSLHRVFFPSEDALSLELMVRWGYLTFGLQGKTGLQTILCGFVFGDMIMKKAYTSLPLKYVDQLVCGREERYVEESVANHSPQSPFWSIKSQLSDLSDLPPTHVIGGWYDFFLTQQLQDYQLAVKKGNKKTRITIGPWAHWDIPYYFFPMLKINLDWFKQNMKNVNNGSFSGRLTRRNSSITTAPPKPGICRMFWWQAHPIEDDEELPVTVFVMNADEWRSFPTWPPPHNPVVMYMRSGGRLKPQPPTSTDLGSKTTYQYNPAKPTPYVGGPSFHPFKGGRMEQSKLERRSDVVCFTSDPFPSAIDVIGQIRCSLYYESSAPYFDVVLRVCVVDPRGSSYNMCEELHRITPQIVQQMHQSWVDTAHIGNGKPHEGEEESGFFPLELSAGSSAFRINAGHRLRIHVCAGAHPRVSRNLGFGQYITEGNKMRVSVNTIFLDSLRPSSIILPIVDVE